MLGRSDVARSFFLSYLGEYIRWKEAKGQTRAALPSISSIVVDDVVPGSAALFLQLQTCNKYRFSQNNRSRNCNRTRELIESKNPSDYKAFFTI